MRGGELGWDNCNPLTIIHDAVSCDTSLGQTLSIFGILPTTCMPAEQHRNMTDHSYYPHQNTKIVEAATFAAATSTLIYCVSLPT